MPFIRRSKEDVVTSIVRDVIDDMEPVASCGCPVLVQSLDAEITEMLLDLSVTSSEDIAECIADIFADVFTTAAVAEDQGKSSDSSASSSTSSSSASLFDPSNYNRPATELFERMQAANLLPAGS